MRPEENPYRSPETVEPPAPQPTAPGRGSRYLAAALTMPLGAVFTSVADYHLSHLIGLYEERWMTVKFPLALFLGAAAAFAVVLRVLSESLAAGWIAIVAGGLTLAAMTALQVAPDRSYPGAYPITLESHGPLAAFSTALLAAGAWWLLRRARSPSY